LKKPGVALLAGLLLFGVLGCVSEGPVVAKMRMRVADIPVPEGMSYLEKESYSREEPGKREFIHIYKGRISNRALASFYKDRLPRYGWKLESDAESRGTRTMEFSKENEHLTIQVYGGLMGERFLRIFLRRF